MRPLPQILGTLLLLAALAACGDDVSETTSADTTEDGGADLATTSDAPGALADDGDGGHDAVGDAGPVVPDGPVALRPLQSSEDRRIVDDLGRDVLLRGVNVTSLGEYWQGDPDHSPTLPTTEEDWQAMASLGVSAIRLVVHWSRIEPEQGVIDQGYLDEVDTYVRAAAAHGIYTVIDMHQDAYTAFIHTPPDEVCPEGTHPAKGWDGAPAWAVITDGLSTCTPGERNASPAVKAAWNHFYDNTDGIRDHFVGAWAAVARRFAGRPEVAGYDILNEPEVPRPANELQPLYDQLLYDSVTAIRAAEVEAGADFEHLCFIEMALPAAHNAYGLVLPSPQRIGLDPRNLVSASHNYAETISQSGMSVSFEEMNDMYLGLAEAWGVPTWIGEYGFWSTSEGTLEKLARYAADEDRRLIGGAWWQWRQPCGDPHCVNPGGDYEVIHLNQIGCPGDVDMGPIRDFTRVLGRGYARATPGRLVSLSSDPETGQMTIEAQATDAGGELIAWTQTQEVSHQILLTGLRDLRTEELPGGRLLFATVEAPGAYRLDVEPRE
jgi:endoglycosylceramidase